MTLRDSEEVVINDKSEESESEDENEERKNIRRNGTKSKISKSNRSKEKSSDSSSSSDKGKEKSLLFKPALVYTVKPLLCTVFGRTKFWPQKLRIIEFRG